MSEWSTYALSDLLMFSARTYYRLIELYNLAIWPLHLLAAVAGVTLVLCALCSDSGRIAAVVLGLCWVLPESIHLVCWPGFPSLPC